LHAWSKEEFSTPRALDLKIHFRMTSSAGFRTSLLILGMSLLNFAIDKLGMEELKAWRNVEAGGDLNGMDLFTAVPPTE
jgi:hypothetical protein